MKFKQFLLNEKNFFYLLERLEINYKDSSIKKISSSHYQFTINNQIYNFYAEFEDFGDFSIYNVYFTSGKELISRKNNLSLTDTYKVFNKVITCMIYFINDQKPEQFTFSTNDPKLQKMYQIIIMKIRKIKPFNHYEIISTGNGYNFKDVGYNQFSRKHLQIEKII